MEISSLLKRLKNSTSYQLKNPEKPREKQITKGFNISTSDSKSLSNSFTTDQKRLPFWILALQNVLCSDENFKSKCINKTNEGDINEIEIKLIKSNTESEDHGHGEDETLLIKHVF